MNQATEYGCEIIYLIEDGETGVCMTAGADTAERELYSDFKVFAKESSVRTDIQNAEEPYPILVSSMQMDIAQLRSGDPVLIKFSDIGVFVAVPVKDGEDQSADSWTLEDLAEDELLASNFLLRD